MHGKILLELEISKDPLDIKSFCVSIIINAEFDLYCSISL